MRTATLALLLALAPATQAAAPPTRSPLRIADLYRLDAPASPALWRGRVAYVRHWIERPGKRERFSLWLVEGKASRARPLEEGEPDARGPVFSPDGKWIAFYST